MAGLIRAGGDPLTQTIEALIEPAMGDMGYTLVRVRVSGSRRPVLQVMAERTDATGMTVEDCAGISRAVSALLDVEDPIQGGFTLEVSSPGIDRPLVRIEDFERFVGFEARIETRDLVDGRKRHRGRLLGRDGDTIRLATETGEVSLPIDGIAQAKLEMTDELIAAAERRQPQTERE